MRKTTLTNSHKITLTIITSLTPSSILLSVAQGKKTAWKTNPKIFIKPKEGAPKDTIAIRGTHFTPISGIQP